MSIETELQNVVAAASALNQTVRGQIDQINATVNTTATNLTNNVNAKLTQIDAWRVSARQEFVFPTTMRYGNMDHNKNELLANNKGNVSPDPSRSKWMRCGTNVDSKSRGYFTEGELVVVCLDRAISYPPGYYENPQYSSDWSATYMQFVIANESATSEEIDSRLEALAITPEYAGSWSDHSNRVRTTAVNVPSLHPYSQLFVRFSNLVGYDPQGRAPQDILMFGGPGIFAIDHVAAYPFSFGGV